jgi:ATP-binding cassette, subfamily B, bacterial MsbA
MKTYLRILGYSRPFTRLYPQYIFFALLAIVFGLLNLTLLKPVFDVIFQLGDPEDLEKYANSPEFSFSIEYFEGLFNYHLTELSESKGRFGALVFVCVVLVSSVFLSSLFTYIANVIINYVRIDVIKKLRTSAFDKITKLHLGYFSDERKGDILSKMSNDVQEIEMSVISSLWIVFKEPATIIIYLIALFRMSTELTLVSLILFPVLGYLISLITKRLRKKARMSQETLGRVLNIMEEVLSGMRIIKAFNAQPYVSKMFGVEINKYASISASMTRKRELASPISQFLGVTVVAGLLLYGGNMVINGTGQLEASEFFVFLIVFSQILTPAKDISKSLSAIQRGIASGERLFKIIDEEPAIQNIPNAVKVSEFGNSIEFKNVGFSYEKELVLNDVSFELKKGQTIALVGSSGAGKSTIADLVTRFYDVTSGEILIDGTNTKDIDIDSLRSLMGVVTQESILFNDSVANNIAFAMPNSNKEDIIKAGKIANAHDFVMELENGYDTNIGERGSKLSGGQRQRLSIARAVMKNPPILILDEATSALDTESEKLVQNAITNLMENRTSIVIAHRLSTIQNADEILVVHKGKIIERGQHDELLKNSGVYAKLISMQSL